MKYFTLVLVLALLVTPAGAYEEEKLKLIKEFLVVNDAQNTLETLRLDNVAQLKNSLVQNFGAGANDPLALRIIARVMERYTELSHEIFNWPKWEKKYTILYADLFNASEIEGIIAFYKSDAGRAMTRATPEIGKRMQQEMFAANNETSAKINAIMQEINAEFKDEVDALK